MFIIIYINIPTLNFYHKKPFIHTKCKDDRGHQIDNISQMESRLYQQVEKLQKFMQKY